MDRVNQLQADAVAVTGDLVDGTVRELADHRAAGPAIGQTRAFVVTGNHEYYSGAGAWITELRRLGLRVLMNEHVVVGRTARRWCGRRDRLFGRPLHR